MVKSEANQSGQQPPNKPSGRHLRFLVEEGVGPGGSTWTSGRSSAASPPPRAVAGAGEAAYASVLGQYGNPREFVDLLPDTIHSESAKDRLRVPIGFTDDESGDVVLGDETPHALLLGPTGSGKTNFLYAMLGGLASRYSPEELNLYLLDYKQGISFANLAPNERDPSWLPHAKLVGIEINEDKEFGLALLRYLMAEMDRRAAAAKAHGATKLSELREADPNGHWPRIVAIIDEFQVMFEGATGPEAAALTDKAARMGRAYGIHLVFASQDMSGIEAFWGKPGTFNQFTLRIGLPKAKDVMETGNNVTLSLPKHHAVLNHESGTPDANVKVKVPDASSKGTYDRLQQEIWEQRPEGSKPPLVFDGSVVPKLAEAKDFQSQSQRSDETSQLIVGKAIEVEDRSAAVSLDRGPGRNLAVIGNSPSEALPVMRSAAISLGAQRRPGECEFTLLDSIGIGSEVQGLADRLRAAGHKVRVASGADVAEEGRRAAEGSDKPNYVFWFGADAVSNRSEVGEDGMSKPAEVEHLQKLLAEGPDQNTHVIGWWRGIGRLKDTIGFGAEHTIGAWVATDVQGNELMSFAGGQVVEWAPRPGRALYFDATTHARPQVIIPYDTSE